MSRYTVVQPKLWWHYMPEDYPAGPQPALSVTDSPPRDTGILDANGRKIVKLTDPIGFVPLK